METVVQQRRPHAKGYPKWMSLLISLVNTVVLLLFVTTLAISIYVCRNPLFDLENPRGEDIISDNTTFVGTMRKVFVIVFVVLGFLSLMGLYKVVASSVLSKPIIVSLVILDVLCILVLIVALSVGYAYRTQLVSYSTDSLRSGAMMDAPAWVGISYEFDCCGFAPNNQVIHWKSKCTDWENQRHSDDCPTVIERTIKSGFRVAGGVFGFVLCLLVINIVLCILSIVLKSKRPLNKSSKFEVKGMFQKDKFNENRGPYKEIPKNEFYEPNRRTPMNISEPKVFVGNPKPVVVERSF